MLIKPQLYDGIKMEADVRLEVRTDVREPPSTHKENTGGG